MKNYNRKSIADEVYLTSITDKKFKVNKIIVNFVTGLSESAAVNAVIPRMLVKCNEKLDTMAKLNRRLSELYSAGISWSVIPWMDYQICQISLSVLDNRYAFDNEDLLRESLDILLDCIFRPCLVNGMFPEQSLELEKQNQLDDNDAEINDKARYSYLRAYEEAFRGEPAAVRWGGTNEQVSAITGQDALDAYRRMINTARTEIVCVGESDFSGIDGIFAEAFAKTERRPEKLAQTTKSSPKSEVLRITEKLDIEQSKLVMIFKTDCADKYVLSVLTQLYGGTESSKLFTNVREKMSLCYYCYARMGFEKGYVSAESGVEEKNLEKAEAECLNQLDEIRKGCFTDDEVDKVKLYMINSIRSVRDTLGGIAGACITDILDPDWAFDTDELTEKINSVTRGQIIEAANTLTLDTVFVLRSDKEAGADE